MIRPYAAALLASQRGLQHPQDAFQLMSSYFERVQGRPKRDPDEWFKDVFGHAGLHGGAVLPDLPKVDAKKVADDVLNNFKKRFLP